MVIYRHDGLWTDTAIVAMAGNIEAGLSYPIVVAIMTFVIGLLFPNETRHMWIHTAH